MKKLIRPMKAFSDFNTSFSGWLRFQIALLISFLIGYHFYLRKYLSINFNKYDEPYDYSYYNSVFNNMEYSCLVVVFIMILLLVNHKRISLLFHKYNWHDRHIWIVIFCSACTQLAIVLFIKTVPISDSNYYIKQGELLYTTGKYISPLGFKTAFWPVGLPGYLCFLHMITDDYLFIAKCINILWSCAYIYLSYNLLKEYLTEKQKVIFVFLIAFLPNNIFSVNVIMTEIYFVVLFLLVLNLVKNDDGHLQWIISGIALGFSAYFRSIGLFLPFLIMLLIKRRSYYKKLLCALSFLIVILPWTYRNYEVFNDFVPMTTNGGYNFLMGNHEHATGGLNFDFEYNLNNPNEKNESDKACQSSFRTIINNPLASVIRLPKKILYSYYRGDSNITWSLKVTQNQVSPLFISLMFFVSNYAHYLIVGFSLLGLLKFSKIDKQIKKFTLLIMSYFLLIIVVYIGGERYIMPIIPFHVFLFAKNF